MNALRLLTLRFSASIRTVLCLLLLLGLTRAQAEMPLLADKEALISWALERFWGNARDSTGTPIQPSSDLDRTTVPVPTGVAYRAIEAGEISGLAAWCGLDWEPHYFALTAAARKQQMSDKQVAFVSMLHGLALGATLRSKDSPCSASERKETEKRLAISKSGGFKAREQSAATAVMPKMAPDSSVGMRADKLDR